MKTSDESRPAAEVQGDAKPLAGRREAGLRAKNARLARALHEAELDLAIQSSTSRILAFALACGTEEEDPLA